MADANREQREYWNERAGPVWVRWQERLDRQIRPHGARAIEALGPRPGERVLDVGCGCGDTALEIARRVGPDGAVLGLDVSAPMLERARERAAEAGLAHLRFQHGDAQVAPLEPASWDALASRFGVMFFEDPVAAFGNLASALRPGGRAAFVCWQPPQANPWVMVPMAAVAPLLEMPPPPEPGAPGMFALGDAERVRAILDRAGFEAVSVEALELAMAPGGGELDRAVELFLEVGPVAALLREQEADEVLRARVASAVRDAFAAHEREGALSLGSAAWLVTARRPL